MQGGHQGDSAQRPHARKGLMEMKSGKRQDGLGWVETMVKLGREAYQQWKGAGILSEVNFIYKVIKEFSAGKKDR